MVRKYLLGISAWFISLILALRLGSVPDASLDLITELRLPRALLSSFIGLGLSVSGAALQALFANPLCEPYTLGISSGAALGAVIGLSLGLQVAVSGVVWTSFVGAILFASILYFISLRSQSKNATILLAGVMLGFLGSSLVALWMAIMDSNGLQGALTWLFGDLSHAKMTGTLLTSISIVTLVFLIWTYWRVLDALLLGEEGAEALGVDVIRIRGRLILLISLLIGVCVSGGGMIGFIGLVVPHFARRWVGSLHLHLIPACAILGAVVLTLADCISRTLVRPYELPVGVVTSLLGAPLFLLILLKRQEMS